MEEGWVGWRLGKQAPGALGSRMAVDSATPTRECRSIKRIPVAGSIRPILPTSCTSWFNLSKFEPGWVGWKKDGSDGGWGSRHPRRWVAGWRLILQRLRGNAGRSREYQSQALSDPSFLHPVHPGSTSQSLNQDGWDVRRMGRMAVGEAGTRGVG